MPATRMKKEPTTTITVFLLVGIASLLSASAQNVECCCDPVTKQGTFEDPQTCTTRGFIAGGLPQTQGQTCNDVCHAVTINQTLPTGPGPALGTVCGAPGFKPAPANASALPVKGEKEFQLRFTTACPALFINISRCQGTPSTCNPKDYKIVKIITPSTAFSDSSDVQWSKDYTYKITAHYAVQGTSDPVIVQGNLGDIECWGQYGTAEFCISESYYEQEPTASYLKQFGYVQGKPADFSKSFLATARQVFGARFNKGWACNDINKVFQIAQPVSCRAGEICVSDDRGAKCVRPSPCGNGKPFGLYNTIESCEGTQQNARYCFFDKSATIINTCHTCQQKMKCYDYKSKGACERDNCGTGSCMWKDVLPTLGVGVCIDTRYKNCLFCDSAGTIGMESNKAASKFYDQCTPKKAEALSTQVHQCFFDFGTGKADDCSTVSCMDFSETQCATPTGGVKLNLDNAVQSGSSSPCGIKVCQWGGNEQKCFKNADGTTEAVGVQDCSPLLKDRKECEMDYFPPETTVLLSGLKGRTDNVFVHITDKVNRTDFGSKVNERDEYQTFWCITSQTNQCTDAKSFTVQTNKTVLEVNDLFFQEGKRILGTFVFGNNIVKYYTKDLNQNLEVVKTVTIPACDKCSGPRLLAINITPGRILGKAMFTSAGKPRVTIDFNEPAEITAAVVLTKAGTATTALDTQKIGQDRYILTPATELTSGNYTFSVNAKDANGVLMDAPIEYDLIVDMTQLTVVVTPFEGTNTDKTTAKSEINFSKQAVLESAILYDHLPLNPYADELVGTEITEEYDTRNNKSFTKTLSKLTDGTKTLTATGEDFSGNKVQKSSTFFVTAKKLNIKLIEPFFGVSPVYIFNLTASSSGRAECRYVFDLPAAPPASQFSTFRAFTKSNKILHTSEGFAQIQQGDARSHLLHVYCKPDLTNNVDLQTFNLSVDTTPPTIITAYADPDPIIEKLLPDKELFETTVKAETDDLGFCKHSNTTQQFSAMEGKFPNYDLEAKRSHGAKVNATENRTYTHYVACKNRAGLVSQTATVTFGVNTATALTVEASTLPLFNSTTFTLGVRTNKRAFCFIGDSQNSILSLFGGGVFEKNHKHTMSVQTAGKYKFFVQCNTGASGETSPVLQLDVVVDNTPPIMKYVTDDSDDKQNPQVSHYKDKLQTSFLGDDNESGIQKYLVTIEESTGKTVLQTESTVKHGKLFFITGNSLALEKDKSYTVTVKAVNFVGLTSKELTSDGVTIRERLPQDLCGNGIKDTGEAGIDCGGACGPCNTPSTGGRSVSCTKDSDCTTNICDKKTNECAENDCEDRIKNGDETGMDCGGGCDPCQAQACATDDDCSTGSCVIGACVAQSNCATSADCASGSCVLGACSGQEAPCSDGKLSDGESDTDCGGPCEKKCSKGQNCQTSDDCATGTCEESTCKETEEAKDKDEDGVPDDKDSCPGTQKGELVDGTGCPTDTDKDGMPDEWEIRYGFDPNDPADAEIDADEDGLKNKEEYNNKADPLNPDTDGDEWSDGDEVKEEYDPIDPESHPSSKLGKYVLWLLILAGLAVGGVLLYKRYQEQQATRPAATKPTQKPVQKQIVQQVQRIVRPMVARPWARIKPSAKPAKPVKSEKRTAQRKTKQIAKPKGEFIEFETLANKLKKTTETEKVFEKLKELRKKK